MSDTSSVSKSGDNSTFTKSIPNSEASSTAGSSKCSTSTASSQFSFEETSKNSSQPGARGKFTRMLSKKNICSINREIIQMSCLIQTLNFSGNESQNPFQQQRQQALPQQASLT